jgi:hypothetical protein
VDSGKVHDKQARGPILCDALRAEQALLNASVSYAHRNMISLSAAKRCRFRRVYREHEKARLGGSSIINAELLPCFRDPVGPWGANVSEPDKPYSFTSTSNIASVCR